MDVLAIVHRELIKFCCEEGVMLTLDQVALFMKKLETKLEQRVVYCQYSDTIRQMPQNYLLAQRVHRAWVCDPDLAEANRDAAIILFKVLLEHENKYGTPEKVLEAYHKEVLNV